MGWQERGRVLWIEPRSQSLGGNGDYVRLEMDYAAAGISRDLIIIIYSNNPPGGATG